MLIIFSKRKDTEFLEKIWEGIDNVEVLYVTDQTPIYEVIEAFERHNRILICGHGTADGLFTPSFNKYIVDSLITMFMQDKEIIGIWCYASKFAEKYKLHGFFTSMFISDLSESIDHCFNNNTPEEIDKENLLFAERVNKLLITDIPLCEWGKKLNEQYDRSKDFVCFNYSGLKYFI